MSYFARELETIMAEKGITTYAQLAEVSGLSDALFSRANKGSRAVGLKSIRSIAAALGTEPTIHARLLAARLREELVPPGGDLVQIEVLGGTAPMRMNESADDNPLKRLPRQQEMAVRNVIAAMPREAGLRDTMLWLGNEVFAPSFSGRSDSAHTDS